MKFTSLNTTVLLGILLAIPLAQAKDSAQPMGPEPVGARPTRATALFGLEVQNHNRAVLGTIDDYAVDIGSGRILYAAMRRPGEEKLLLVPLHALTFDFDRGVAELRVSSADISRAVTFAPDRWPVGSAWGAAPAVHLETSPEPPTLVDHALAARIRAALVHESSGPSLLSSSQMEQLELAVRQGKVMLRGSIASAQEQRAVIAMIQSVPGVRTVESQLTIREPLP